MSDMSHNPTEQVAAQDPTEAVNYNVLEMFSRFWGVVADDLDETPNQNVDLPTLFSRWIQNVRLERLTSTTVRVPYSPDRPPSMVIDGHLVQATADVDSSTISGSAATLYVIAVRSGTTFTIEVRTSSSEGSDERCIGSLYWDGAAVVKYTLVAYESDYHLERDERVSAWACVGATGTIYDSFNVASATNSSTGVYDIVLDRPMDNANYTVVITVFNNPYLGYINSMSTSGFQIRIVNLSSALQDKKFSFIVMGSPTL
jgi:hypothetical protein